MKPSHVVASVLVPRKAILLMLCWQKLEKVSSWDNAACRRDLSSECVPLSGSCCSVRVRSQNSSCPNVSIAPGFSPNRTAVLRMRLPENSASPVGPRFNAHSPFTRVSRRALSDSALVDLFHDPACLFPSDHISLSRMLASQVLILPGFLALALSLTTVALLQSLYPTDLPSPAIIALSVGITLFVTEAIKIPPSFIQSVFSEKNSSLEDISLSASSPISSRPSPLVKVHVLPPAALKLPNAAPDSEPTDDEDDEGCNPMERRRARPSRPARPATPHRPYSTPPPLPHYLFPTSTSAAQDRPKVFDIYAIEGSAKFFIPGPDDDSDDSRAIR